MSDLQSLKFICAVIFCIIQLSWSVGATNYCDPKLCNGKQHIACNNNGAFASTCGTAKVMPLSLADRQIILTMHNEMRNRVAMGQLNRFMPSVRMATMTWDDELAKLALLNAKRCKMEHDACRKTDAFPKAGQNLSKCQLGGKNRPVMTIVREQIQQWFDENKYTSMQDINNLTDTPRFHSFGHFTAMITEKNSRVGCGIVHDTRNGVKTQYLACDYACANILQRPIYQKGVTASQCTSGKNPKYPGLCSVNEKYDYSVGGRSLDVEIAIDN